MSKIIEVTDETHALVRLVAAQKGIFIKDWVKERAESDAKELGLVRWCIHGDFPDKFLDEKDAKPANSDTKPANRDHITPRKDSSLPTKTPFVERSNAFGP